MIRSVTNADPGLDFSGIGMGASLIGYEARKFNSNFLSSKV